MGSGGSVGSIDGTGGSTEASGGAEGNSGGSMGSGGSGAPPGPVNFCTEFLERMGDAEARVIPWDFGIGAAPERCLRIRVGQSVTFRGPLSTHPLAGGGGGDTPNPITGNYPEDAEEYAVEFPNVGLFGFECGDHTAMRGAIDVVP